MSLGPPQRPRTTLKTYSHLGGGNTHESDRRERRMPSEYEVVSSQLLYYVPRGGFEVDVPLGAWYARHQAASMLRAADWELFRDPRATTYTTYVTLQRDRETYIDGLFASMDDPAYARALSPEWTRIVSAALFPLRFALQGLQMTAAYVAQMAPGGRIVIASLFQAADEVRRIQRISYRMALARRDESEIESRARAAWQRDPAWQPLREVIERLLVTFDWGHAFTALNLAVKPWLDALVNVAFARHARASGDPLLAEMLRSFGEDATWQRAWSRALVSVAREEGSAEAVRAWSAEWQSASARAVGALAPVFGVRAADLQQSSLDVLGELTGEPR